MTRSLDRTPRAALGFALAVALLATPTVSDAGFTNAPKGPNVGFAPNPQSSDPTSAAINQNVRAAIALIRGTGRTIEADAIERKLREGNICMEISRREPGFRGLNPDGTCEINIKIDIILNPDNVEELAYVLLHEYTHTTTVFSQPDIEHCYAYWQQFLYVRDRLAQIGTGSTNEEKAARLQMLLDQGTVLAWYPEFGAYSDPEVKAPLTPPGDFSDPNRPDRTLKDCRHKSVSAHPMGSTPRNAIYYTSGTGDVFGSVFDYTTGTSIDVTVATGLDEISSLEAVILGSSGEHALLAGGLDPMSGEPKVAVLTDTNADRLADSAAILSNLGAPLQSVTALMSALQPGGENDFMLLDSDSGEVRHIEDLDANGVPDAIGGTYAALALTPSLQDAEGIAFLGQPDNSANPTEPTTPCITSFDNSEDRLPGSGWVIALRDTNGDGVADAADAPAMLATTKASAPDFALQPMHKDSTLWLAGTASHSIEVRAIRGTTTEVLATFTPTVGGLSLPGYSNWAGAQVLLSRPVTRADFIRLVDLDLGGGVAPVERGVSSMVPEIRSVSPSIITPTPAGNVVLDGRNFKHSSRVMFDSPQLDDPIEGTVVSVTSTQIVVTPPTVAGPTQLNVFVRASGRPDSNQVGLAYQLP